MNINALLAAVKAAGYAWQLAAPAVDEYAAAKGMTRVQVLEALRDAAIVGVDDSAAFHMEFWRERVALFEESPTKATALNLLTLTGMDPTYYALWWKRRLSGRAGGQGA